MKQLSRKINILSIAIIILLCVTISMQGIVMDTQAKGKIVRDRNFNNLKTDIDSLKEKQRSISEKVDTLKDQFNGIKKH